MMGEMQELIRAAFGTLEPNSRCIEPLHRSYLVLPNFHSAEDTQAMLERAKKLIDDFDLNVHPMVRLSSLNGFLFITKF